MPNRIGHSFAPSMSFSDSGYLRIDSGYLRFGRLLSLSVVLPVLKAAEQRLSEDWMFNSFRCSSWVNSHRARMYVYSVTAVVCISDLLSWDNLEIMSYLSYRSLEN